MEISFEDRKEYWAKHQEAMQKEAPVWLSDIGGKHPEFGAYLYYMMGRLRVCRQALKPTGSIYLHCDWRASHYLKIVMDDIFGENNFRNEIIWCYSRPSAPSQRQFSKTHEVILFYSKAYPWTFNPDEVRIDYAPESLARAKRGVITSKIANPEDGVVLHKKGKFPEDWWLIPSLRPNARERVGYPTQKPLALLERIIKAPSNEGDCVLDPFCGCGTAIIASHKHNRQWIGIDINKEAWGTIQRRANQPSFYQWLNSFKEASYISRDLDEVMVMNPHEFEVWVNQYYGATKPKPEEVVGGITKEGIPIQTKAYKTPVDYTIVDAFYAGIKLHPKLLGTISQGRIVSQNGFTDSARHRVFEIEYREKMKIVLTTPEDMLKEQTP